MPDRTRVGLGRIHATLEEGARAVVPLRNDQEVARQPVQLRADQVTMVRF